MAQRHIGEIDLAILMYFGTETVDGYMMDKRAFTSLTDHAKRLQNSMVVVADGVAVTVQRLKRSKARRKRRQSICDD
jgi:hypothetical protein